MMLNFIKELIITNKVCKIRSRFIKEQADIINAQTTRETDIAMTKMAELVTDYFITRNK